MRQIVCAVFDSAIGSFMNPIFAPALGAVVRSFTDEVNRAESPMYAHPDDYVLWELCEFESETGEFHGTNTGKRIVARGKDVRRE